MDVIADLHVHSRFSRATSKQIDIGNLEKWARIKGVGLLGTGDFQHPLWFRELKENLREDGSGVLRSGTGFPFILQTEVSNIYTQGGKGRRVHSIVLAPGFGVAEQIQEALGKRGRLDYDGRPIFGFSCAELVEMMRGISRDIEVIPAHAWTPWFSVFGSKSGFDSLEECFQEKARHVHAIETGLSSDPEMNWRVSSLDGVNLVSFSDMHSFWPHRMGREATVFRLKEVGYRGVLSAIRTGKGLVETIEVDAAYGKYHWDGHRNCGVRMEPRETIKNHGVCPKCRKGLTIGVEHRVEELADRPRGHRPEGAKPFRRLIPLSEIIGAVVGSQAFSKKTWEVYHRLVKAFGSEFGVLLEAGSGAVEEAAGKGVARAVMDAREGGVKVEPGYDGVYGVPSFREAEAKRPEKPKEPGRGGQRSLGDFTHGGGQ